MSCCIEQCNDGGVSLYREILICSNVRNSESVDDQTFDAFLSYLYRCVFLFYRIQGTYVWTVHWFHITLYVRPSGYVSVYMIGLKCTLGDRSFSFKKGALFRGGFYLPSFCRLSSTNWWDNGDNNGWPCFVCIFQFFSCWWNLMIRPASTTVLLSLPNSVFIATYDWLRGLVHLHCDVMIKTSAMKTWCSYWSYKGKISCLRTKNRHQKAMLTR